MNCSRSLGHFLENRQSFLKNIAMDVLKQKTTHSETKLLQSLRSDSHPKTESKSASSSNDPTLSMMLQCSMHLGHSKSYWNPHMSKYILGERAGIHIIDLEKSLSCLRQASSVAAEIAHKGGKILFVGTSPFIQRMTYEAATYCNQYYVNRRWIGGTITNSKNIIGSNDKPDLVIILDLKRNLVAAKECIEACIPIVAICDTDCDPTKITYPIPSNDESLPAVEMIVKSLALAVKKGSNGNINE